ncbi:MAG: DNA polymerase IV [Armatimonadota bacterium]
MTDDRTIILVDMDAFFASIEQQCNPGLRGKPVLVGGSLTGRSVISAASYEARAYGIHSAMPVMEAIGRCPDAVLVHGNLSKYTDTAHRVFKICGDYTDLMEIYSIDECFLDVTGTAERFGGAWDVARNIKRRIKSELGLTCSIGIAQNKMLSKLASGMGKPDGLMEIKKDDVEALLKDLSVEKLHGIGDKVRVRLARMGITKASELARASRPMLKREFGVFGDVLYWMGNGVDQSPIIPYHSEPDMKSVGHSYTMERNTRDLNIVCRHLLRLSEMVGRQLREQHFAGRTVTLVVRYADMHTFSRQRSIPEYIDDGYAIYRAALSILRKQDDDKRAIRLVGVSVSNLVKGACQLDLFADPRVRSLLKAMDAINDRYGEFTIKRASLIP